MLLAVQFVLTRIIVIQTDIIRISFGFLPHSLSAMLFGPIVGAAAGAVEDVLGILLLPKGTPFFGFTVSAAITGLIYGFFLYKKPKTLARITLAVLFTTVIVDLCINTLWLSILTGNAAAVIFPARLLKSVIMFPVQTAMIYAMWQTVGSYIEKRHVLAGT
jgi:ECF transporter S component (folate family)